MSFLKNIDLLGKTVKFDINGADTFRTNLGGFFSIFIYIGVVALTWFFGEDIYERDHPKQNNFIKFLPKFPFIEINEYNFAVGIAIYDQNDLMLDD